ncbi:adhesion protein FadA [Fusobacterium polymorphum]|uniref:Adhesion protein FadA n=1 Tax=Fusobacterium nucleatum subsp. polymorphum TaxID=76857 RepID=A0A2C6C165_FUSNP|nr:adhesion protein FadA [Fusobacterium polymorphum]PHI10163.1 adhesion protein FadA [Fusobacterium polymorphum]
MKKVILVLCILFSAVVFANNEILLELKGLENEYEILVKEEETCFQKERELSEKAAAQNIDLEKLKASIEEKLATAPEERKTKFFKDTFDGLVKDYSVYLSQIEQKIAENTQLVSNFEKIKAIR